MTHAASEHPHRRFNPLSGDWVLVSPHRMNRPWNGQADPPEILPTISRDTNCYLCPGNRRASGDYNPAYAGPYVFDNDFPAVLENVEFVQESSNPLFRSQSARGRARVICYSGDHSKTLPLLSQNEVEAIVSTWGKESRDLHNEYANVQIFENRGLLMGCSNPHPHGQIWSTKFIPSKIQREHESQDAWFREHGSVLLMTLAEAEASRSVRTVVESEYWICLVPYWAEWPFETLLLPKIDVKRMHDLPDSAASDLASILKELTTIYDNLFACSFPYSMGWHGAPAGVDDSGWLLHAHFYPPLLRSASVRKFMVGFEMLAEAQRDLTPEMAAEKLRSARGVHYSMSSK